MVVSCGRGGGDVVPAPVAGLRDGLVAVSPNEPACPQAHLFGIVIGFRLKTGPPSAATSTPGRFSSALSCAP